MTDMRITPGVQYLHDAANRRLNEADQTIALLVEQMAVKDEAHAQYRARVEKLLTPKQKAALEKAE